MSNYRPIYTQIWSDIDFSEYAPEQQLIFLFLMTSEMTKCSGIYKITPKQISFNTNLDLNKTKLTLKRYPKKQLEYDFDNGIVYIKNFFKYSFNSVGNYRVVIGSLRQNIKLIPHVFWLDFFKKYSNIIEKLNYKIEEDLNNGKKVKIKPLSLQELSLSVKQDLINSQSSLSQDFNSNRDRNRNRNINSKNSKNDAKSCVVLNNYQKIDNLLISNINDNDWDSLVKYFYNTILTISIPPTWQNKDPSFKSWANDFKLLLTIDLKKQYQQNSEETLKVVEHIIDFAANDKFWKNNILSASKFRKQFLTLFMQAQQEREGNGIKDILKNQTYESLVKELASYGR